MPSKPKSKSYRLKSKKFKFVPKSKKQWQPTRNWLELPSDLMLNILQRIDVIERLENAQLVCTAWREICKDPAMWRVIHIEVYSEYPFVRAVYKEMCKLAVDRSQGQLLDLTLIRCCDSELLQYVADRSSQLRRLEIVYNFDENDVLISKAFNKLSLLEELSLVGICIMEEDIEAVGRYCPLLKTLKMNQKSLIYWKDDADYYGDDVYVSAFNEIAQAIAKNLPNLTHLELIGNCLNNNGLQAILDGCCHLEALDLRQCYYHDLKTDLGKRCYRQIKHLKLPHDSLEGYLRAYDIADDSDDEYEGCSECDYTSYDSEDDNDDDGSDDGDALADYIILKEMMAFMDMFG
ncbi:putative F-box/LRR-repeat protein 9 [Bidens hawaiensis]|uniref:putative F-box/LRR-repeat protein 9 n=1 Tax=Bidens hawaiensis TaxID=980011 RepID=UPI004049BB7F